MRHPDRYRRPRPNRPIVASAPPIVRLRVLLSRALPGQPSRFPPSARSSQQRPDLEERPPVSFRRRRWPRLLLALGLLAPLVATPFAAHAHELEPHHVQVQAGPYPVEVGFSEWPVLAERAVDITFMPEGGITDKTATIALVSPGEGGVYDGLDVPLGRHPRQRDYWGLDLIAFPAEGDWTLALAVDGPAGSGETTLPLPVGPRPGPPPLPMWLLGILPAVAVVALIAGGWRSIRPGRTAEAGAWT